MASKREIYVGLHCTVVGDRTKTRMNDEYSFAMFLVTFLRVKKGGESFSQFRWFTIAKIEL